MTLTKKFVHISIAYLFLVLVIYLLAYRNLFKFEYAHIGSAIATLLTVICFATVYSKSQEEELELPITPLNK